MKKCCETCGMLACNTGKPTPEGSEMAWYSQENMDRLWAECRLSGDFLICHSTDPNAKNYGGNEKIKPGKETACLGLALWIYMHIKIFEVHAAGNFGKYRNIVGHKIAMERNAMHKAALNFLTGSTGFGTKGPFKGLLIPREHNEDRELAYPTGFDKVRKLFKQAVA